MQIGMIGAGRMGYEMAGLLARGQFAIAPPYFDRVEADETPLDAHGRVFWRLHDSLCSYGLVDLDMAWNEDSWARRTSAGFDALRGMGCNVFQGWLFGRPMAPAACEARYAADPSGDGASRSRTTASLDSARRSRSPV